MSPSLARLIALSGITFMAIALTLLAAASPGYWGPYAMIFVIAVPLILSGSKVLSGELYWFSPHTAFVGGLFLIYVLATAAMIHYRVESTAWDRAMTPVEYTRSLKIVLVAVCCYMLGWRFGPKKQTMPRGLEWYFTDTPAVRATFDWACLGLIALGLLAWVYIFSFAGGIQGQLANMSGRGQTVSEAGGWVMHIAFFSYAGILLYFSRHGLNPISITAIGAFLFILLLFGSRSYAGTLVLGVLAVYTFRHRAKLPLIVWIAAGVGLFGLMSFWVILRGTAGRFDRAAHIYQQEMSTTEGFVMRSVGDFMFMPQYAAITDAMPLRIEPQRGRTFLGVLKFIPEKIWKKDLPDAASVIYVRTFFPARVGKISLSVPSFLEYYLNLLWPGVIVLSFLNGIISRWLDSVLLRHPHRRFQVPHIVIAGLMIGFTLKFLKEGPTHVTVQVYYRVLLPVAIVYFPNISLLFNPPRDGSTPELGDMPSQAFADTK